MSTIGIETAQNVALHHEVASVGDRLLAFIIDMLVKVAWLVVAGLFYQAAELHSWPGWAHAAYWVVAALPLSFYWLACELLMQGRSIGKGAMRIQVARIDGSEPTLGQYLLRWLIRPLDGFYGLGLVVMLINGRGQRIGDLAAGTTVVSTKPRAPLGALLADEAAGYQPRFPEAVRLSDAQAGLIREVLGRRGLHDPGRLMEEMAEKVRRAIGNPGTGMEARAFLEAVLRDHAHLTAGQGPGTGQQQGR